jgi:hypothetical protein
MKAASRSLTINRAGLFALRPVPPSHVAQKGNASFWRDSHASIVC